MNKLQVVFSLFIFHFSFFTSSAQQWMWGREGTTESDTYGISADKNGNVFLPGYFLDSITFSGKHLLSPREDAYVVKYDSNGNLLWAKQSLSLIASAYCIGIYSATDVSGNVFLTGVFSDSVSIGTTKLYTTATYGAPFLAKYDANGNVLWAKQAIVPSKYSGGSGLGLATDASGNVYLTGSFLDTMSFGAVTVRNSQYGSQDAFLMKFDPNGNALWGAEGITSGSNGYGQGYAVNVDDLGNAYITGIFSDTISFGATKLKTTFSGNCFLVKYSTNGGLIWVKQAGQNSSKCYGDGASVLADHLGGVYLTGIFADTISFGPYSVKNNNQVNGPDMFLTKYDSAGKVIWAKQSTHADTVDGWSGYSLAVDKYNHIYLSAGVLITYSSHAKVVFCGKTFSETNAIDPSIMLMLDTAANILNSSIISTGGDDENTVACDPTGRYVYLGGDIADTITFGPDHLSITPGEPPFVARWNPYYITTDEGINELITNSEELRVYPNPSHGVFAFEVKSVPSTRERTKSVVEVYNMLGEKVYSGYQISKSSNYQIDLSAQPNGVYLYRVISEKGVLVGMGKLVIEK